MAHVGKHGGPRPNSGRKKGALTRKTRRIAEEAAEKGILPLEVMVENMRFYHQGAQTLVERLVRIVEKERENGSPISGAEKFNAYSEMLNLRALAQGAARDAAQFFHPKLAAIEHTGADGGPIEIVSKAQRDAAVAAALRADT